MITSLTKENFWNEMMEKYPEQMKVFCAWIDEYKKRVEWEHLFVPHLYPHKPIHGMPASEHRPPKYHELPIAMQIGIFAQFVSEQEVVVKVLSIDGMVTGIRDFFEEMKLQSK